MSAGHTLDVELLADRGSTRVPLEVSKVRRLCALAAASAGVHAGHLAVELVCEERIRELNAAYRGKDGPTDVLSFPIDGADAIAPPGASVRADGDDERIDGLPRELGDVLICPPHTRDIYEAIVHGVLHLVGLDHECDQGEMLALQAEILRWENLQG